MSQESPHKSSERWIDLTVFATVLMYGLAHWFLGDILANGWSFTYVVGDESWSPVFIYSCALFIGTFILRYHDKIVAALSNRLATVIALAVVGVCMVQFRFDSLLFGGGNEAVFSIAQADVIVHRWYEFGSSVYGVVISEALKSFGVRDIIAGTWALRSFSYISAILAVIGAVKLTRLLTESTPLRLWLILVAIGGGPLLLAMGYPGIESMFLALSVWAGYFMVQAAGGNRRALIWLWLVVAVGIVFHVSAAFFVPGALYVSLTSNGAPRNRSLLAGGLTLVAYLVGLVLISHLSGMFAYGEAFLGLSGRPPFPGYSIFSARHLGDVVQIILLLFPLIFVMKAIAWRSLSRLFGNAGFMGLWWLCLGGVTVVMVLNPIHSVVLDLPRLAGYLAPLGVIFAVMLADRVQRNKLSTRTIAQLATAGMILPMLIWPGHLSTQEAAPRVETYLNQHLPYYRTATIELRDAFFYDKDFDQANYWQAQMIVRSVDMLNLRGCRDLGASGQYYEAMGPLRRIIASNPYWSEPRLMETEIQITLGRFDNARHGLDSLAELIPYSARRLSLESKYHAGLGALDSALSYLDRALLWTPDDVDLHIDRMVLLFRLLQNDSALAEADYLITRDSTNAYAYWLKGAVADRRNDTAAAIELYRRYTELAEHEDEDFQTISRRLNDLVTAYRRDATSGETP